MRKSIRRSGFSADATVVLEHLTEELQSDSKRRIDHYVRAELLYEGLDTRKLSLDRKEVREVRRQQAENLNALGLAYTKERKT